MQHDPSVTHATIGHLIDGKTRRRRQPLPGRVQPATGQVEKRVLLADAKATMEQAIASARPPTRPGAPRRRSSARA
jgi:hypothetical protein